MEKIHYYYNPISDEMIVTENGKICGGCSGDVAAAVARIQSIDDPESITFDLNITTKNSKKRIAVLKY